MTEKSTPSRRGRPPKDPEAGAMSPATRQRVYRRRKQEKDRDLARAVAMLLLAASKNTNKDAILPIAHKEIDVIEDFFSRHLNESMYKNELNAIKKQSYESKYKLK